MWRTFSLPLLVAPFVLISAIGRGDIPAPSIPPPATASAVRIDNSALIPPLLPDDQVKMEGMSPDWTKTLIMAEVRIETATMEGTFASATQVLDHYQEMGVNGLWICPIWERGSKKAAYGNFGIDTIEPQLTGATNYDDSCAVVKRFVDEAHRRNIRVIFDAVVWGTKGNAPLVQQHPEFYQRTPDGQFKKSWTGYAFDWKNAGLKEWYRGAAVNFILKTGADGFRVDLAPSTSGYFFKEIRDALSAQGYKIVIMSETQNERKDTFDFEENGVNGMTEEPDYAHPLNLKEQKKRVGPHGDYLLRANLVDVIHSGAGIGKPSLQRQGQGGMFRFYTDNLLNHDDSRPLVQGNRVRFGYSILAPFLPLWWIGEEWNNPRVMATNEKTTGVMYFNIIDWDALDIPVNRAFYEDAKQFLRIRRTYPEIFEDFPESTRNANIVKVDSTRDGVPNGLQAYARFTAGKAVLVVPNNESMTSSPVFEITPPFAALGFAPNTPFTITDLISGRSIAHGVVTAGTKFTQPLAAEYLGVYLLEAK